MPRLLVSLSITFKTFIFYINHEKSISFLRKLKYSVASHPNKVENLKEKKKGVGYLKVTIHGNDGLPYVR